MTQEQQNANQQLYALLHATYTRKTGREIPFTTRQIWAWEAWVHQGHFTLSDLELVLEYIQAMIRKGERRIESLRFETITRDFGKFEDDLAQAKADKSFRIKVNQTKVQPATKVIVTQSSDGFTSRVVKNSTVPEKIETPAQILPERPDEMCARLRKFASEL